MVAASVFLPSYNKGEYVLEAIESVRGQTFQDWECWILENSTDKVTRKLIRKSGLLKDKRFRYTEIDFTEDERKRIYPPARLLNYYYPQANGGNIFYLSDDDLFKPACLERCTEYLASHPEHDVCYFTLESVSVVAPRSSCLLNGYLMADKVRDRGSIARQIDGGQVVHRKACLDALAPPYFQETLSHKSKLTDGIFLVSLAKAFPAHPIPEILGTKRVTPISTWMRYDSGVGRPVPGIGDFDMSAWRTSE